MRRTRGTPLFVELVRDRSRLPVGSRAWLRLWLRRARRAPGLALDTGRTEVLRVRGATIGRRVIVRDLRVAGPATGLELGDGTAVDTAVFLVRGRIQLGRHVAVNFGATLLAATHNTASPRWELEPVPIVVEDYAWIGTNATVVGPCRIGRGAVVGAGAVVRKDVADGAIVVGNPAQVVGQRPSDSLSYSPAENWPLLRAWSGRRFDDVPMGPDSEANRPG